MNRGTGLLHTAEPGGGIIYYIQINEEAVLMVYTAGPRRQAYRMLEGTAFIGESSLGL